MRVMGYDYGTYKKQYDSNTRKYQSVDGLDDNEYLSRMLLVEAGNNDLIFHNINNTAFFDMLKVILDKNIPKNEAKKKIIEYAVKHKVDKTVVLTIAGATNTNIDYNAFEKGDGDMCTLFDEIAKEGEARGEARGEAKGIIETGFDFGLSEHDILERLQKKLNISLQQAQEYFGMFKKQTI